MREISRLLCTLFNFVNVIGVYSNPKADDKFSAASNTPTLKKYTSDLNSDGAREPDQPERDFERESINSFRY